MKKISNFFKVLWLTLQVILAIILIIIFIMWCIWDLYVLKFFFPKWWEKREEARYIEYTKWLNEQTKNRGWAFQDLS